MEGAAPGNEEIVREFYEWCFFVKRRELGFIKMKGRAKTRRRFYVNLQACKSKY